MTERLGKGDAYVEQGFDRGRSRRPPPRIPESDGFTTQDRASNQKRVEDGLGQKMPDPYLDELIREFQQKSLYPDAELSKLLSQRNGSNRRRNSSK